MRLEYLFVYGTLAPGKPNAHILGNVKGTWTPATVKGKLLPDGWGAALGYPGIVLDQQGTEVDGLVFQSSELEYHWARLDEFEGDAYVRTVTQAKLANGEFVDAYIYALSGN